MSWHRNRLAARMNHFHLDSLKKQLKPFRLYFYPRLRSTNEHASLLRRTQKLYCPAVVLTNHQIAGRGRGNNTWWSGTGSLTVTFAVPTDDRIAPHHVPLIAGLAVHRALCGDISGLKLKWPNDLWHDDLKLAGMLCERVNGADLIGIGLNVNIDLTEISFSLRHRVTSLQAISGKRIALQQVLTAISVEIDKLLLKKQFGSFGAILPEYNRVHALEGRLIRVTEPDGVTIQGQCEGLDAEGRLLLRSSKLLHRVVAGHVELA